MAGVWYEFPALAIYAREVSDYWMADIAVQMTTLAQCALRNMPTNVEAELGKDASAEEIIQLVVRV
jgi:hypothetical protein